jgi:hypothetical protein
MLYLLPAMRQARHVACRLFAGPAAAGIASPAAYTGLSGLALCLFYLSTLGLLGGLAAIGRALQQLAIAPGIAPHGKPHIMHRLGTCTPSVFLVAQVCWEVLWQALQRSAKLQASPNPATRLPHSV